MLDRSTSIIPPLPSQAVSTGQSIAKSARYKSPRQRAREAAEWVLGGKIIKPSTKLAATAYQVSEQLIREEVAKIKDHEAIHAFGSLTAVDHLFDAMTPTERAEFILTHEDAIWAVLDHLTS